MLPRTPYGNMYLKMYLCAHSTRSDDLIDGLLDQRVRAVGEQAHCIAWVGYARASVPG